MVSTSLNICQICYSVVFESLNSFQTIRMNTLQYTSSMTSIIRVQWPYSSGSLWLLPLWLNLAPVPTPHKGSVPLQVRTNSYSSKILTSFQELLSLPSIKINQQKLRCYSPIATILWCFWMMSDLHLSFLPFTSCTPFLSFRWICFQLNPLGWKKMTGQTHT